MTLQRCARFKPLAAALIAAALTMTAATSPAGAENAENTENTTAETGMATPIKHLVVLFQENISFDHYFGTYPNVTAKPGEPTVFTARPGTPRVNGLTAALLEHNPNSANPMRLDRSDAHTCSMDHNYAPEQRAYHDGKVDRFVEETGNHHPGCDPKAVMGYYDGATVTAMWNYAQHFALNDNSYGTTYGPSSPGAINLISGQTHGVQADSAGLHSKGVMDGTVIGDDQPLYDDCSSSKTPIAMNGKNAGDLLNAKGVTWGWFEGGFRATSVDADGKAVCGASHAGSDGQLHGDYLPHHEPFQYYSSTANPHHLPPSSVAMIGKTDAANHQYDLSDFWAALDAHNLPAVSYLKAPAYEDGHPGYSGPLQEQQYLVDTINRLQQSPEWKDMAIVIAYDDSDGWYDHQMPPTVNPAGAPAAPGTCDQAAAAAGDYVGRCGYGPRLPFLVISPYARENFVDHHVTDQSAILRFIEDNWKLGRIGDASFDERAGSLLHMFDFQRKTAAPQLILDRQSGQIATQ
ncbi:MAG TPA: alkaline phosphatase family protein [Herbaspirillum sp.]|nr:alkaline phosphatase family protein [Herbaspirillum sp.]